MAQAVTTPDPLVLIPPLLAYLPTSFASTRPPPALIPLLSPILRQRVHIHTTSSDSHDSWLRLLCWDSAKADILKDTVENANFEPHPVSGEIEVGDIDTITYKRADRETLKAHLPLSDWDLSAIYLWCTGGDEEDGWKLAELFPFDSDLSRDPSWFKSIPEAEEAVRQKYAAELRPTMDSRNSSKLSVGGEDDYWAMYDGTPSRTPVRNASADPTGSNVTEDDYYARYSDVQPALDNHDPDEAHEELGESSLNGNALREMLAQNSKQVNVANQATNNVFDLPVHREEEEEPSVPVRQPSPSSPRSRASSDTVERLENQAEKNAASEIGIRHHIGYSIKSMYRLAKSAGISRQDFEDMVQREMETLSILDHDE